MLHGASFNLLQCLVKELGADIDRTDKDGWTAVMEAAETGNVTLLRNLAKELGANVWKVSKAGAPPLHLAARPREPGRDTAIQYAAS